MAGFTDLTNRFNHGEFGEKQLDALKSHISEYFIVGEGTKGIANLRLDIIGDETLTVDSDVTDHYVESNTAYQDQISIKPKIYTVSGEVGELVWYQKDSASQIFGQVAQRLEGVISFLPVRSKSFNQFKDKAMKVAQWVDTASNVASKISNLWNSATTGSLTHQQQAYQELLAMRDNRQPLPMIKTPWGILQDYVITNIKLTQPKETKDKSFISISFKEFRTVSVSTVKFDPEKYQGNAVFEHQPKTDNGTTSGLDESTSVPNNKEGQEEMGLTEKSQIKYGGYISSVKDDTGITYPIKYLDGKLTIYSEEAATGKMVEVPESWHTESWKVYRLATERVDNAIREGRIPQ